MLTAPQTARERLLAFEANWPLPEAWRRPEIIALKAAAAAEADRDPAVLLSRAAEFERWAADPDNGDVRASFLAQAADLRAQAARLAQPRAA